jgi:hypothetical protein
MVLNPFLNKDFVVYAKTTYYPTCTPHLWGLPPYHSYCSVLFIGVSLWSKKTETMNKYLSTTELQKKYPELTLRFDWTKKKLGFFMRNKILTGYYIRNKRTTMILESSLLELMQFMKPLPKEEKEEFTTDTI